MQDQRLASSRLLKPQFLLQKVGQIILQQYHVTCCDIPCHPGLRLGKAGAGDDLGGRRRLFERFSKRGDAMRRHRDEHVDVVGGKPADAPVLVLMHGPEFDHARCDEDAPSAGSAQQIEHLERRRETDRVGPQIAVGTDAEYAAIDGRDPTIAIAGTQGQNAGS